MIRLTDEQVVAAASLDGLINIVSAPGSGKTTVAAERFGYLRNRDGDSRGVLGLSFTRSAVGELTSRIQGRWGTGCLSFPHRVMTFDALYVRMLHWLITEGVIRWPGGHTQIQVVDDYRGYRGYRWLNPSSFRRIASMNSTGQVISQGVPVRVPGSGIGNVGNHRDILSMGVCSHEDVRHLLTQAAQSAPIESILSDWVRQNFRELVIDEVYDAAPLDLYVALMAAEAGLGVTIIGDPRQALYGWRGATPEKVEVLLASAPSPFRRLELPHSFRFSGPQMPTLAEALRRGRPVTLPRLDSADVDVALARQWRHLWPTGDNVLPLAFRNVANATDAAINLLLDVATRAHLGLASYGRESAIIQLGVDREVVNREQTRIFTPILELLSSGADEEVVIDRVRDAVVALGGRRPNRLRAATEATRLEELAMLALRTRQERLIPGLTVHQAKGREWDRVGVALSEREGALLSVGLQELRDDDCVVYVALTRAKSLCGRLNDDLALNFEGDG